MKVLVAKVVGLFVVFALALFLPAGTIAWFAAWVFLALFFSFGCCPESVVDEAQPWVDEGARIWA